MNLTAFPICPRRLASLSGALLLCLAVALGACSSSEIEDDNEANQDRDTGPIEDGGDDSADGGDAGDDADTDPCPVCCAGDQRCTADGSAIEICNDDGDGYEVTSTCADDEICEEAQCVPEPVCEPGQTRCDGSDTLLTCRATGTGYSASDCPEGQSCHDDECQSGQPTGALCDDATDCVGGSCRCGSDETCAIDQTAYCTTECTPDSCSGNELCWQTDGAEPAGYDHCVLPCGAGGCELSQCQDILVDVDGELTWESACLPSALQGIGDECSGDSECLSGVCDQDSYPTARCTRACDEGGCPEGTACVDAHGNGQPQCYPECEGNQCSFSINCSSFTSYDGGLVDICVPSE